MLRFRCRIRIDRELPPVGVNLAVLVEFLEQDDRHARCLQDLEEENRHRIGYAVRVSGSADVLPAR